MMVLVERNMSETNKSLIWTVISWWFFQSILFLLKNFETAKSLSQDSQSPGRGLKLGTKSCPTTRHEGDWVERKYSSYSLSISALDGGELPTSCPIRILVPEKGPPGTHCIGGWVGPRAGLDIEATGNFFISAEDRTSISRSSSP
jgi:hypothetical protein